MRFFRRKPVASARQVRDEWLAWLELGGARPATVKGYRWTTDRLLDRYPELTFDEFTDEHILGIIEESNPASRQARRSAFANWFGWGYRAKRLKHNPMHHVPTYKQPDQQPVDVFTETECAVLCALPEPDGTLMALLLGSGLRKSEASNLTLSAIRRAAVTRGSSSDLCRPTRSRPTLQEASLSAGACSVLAARSCSSGPGSSLACNLTSRLRRLSGRARSVRAAASAHAGSSSISRCARRPLLPSQADNAATTPDFVAEHAREGVEWLRKLSVMQSRSDLIEKFDRMARAVETLLAEHEAARS